MTAREAWARPLDPPPAVGPDRAFLGSLALGLGLAAAAGTQYAAWRAHFAPRLGAPLLVLGTPTVRVIAGIAVVAASSALAALLVPALRRVAGPLGLVALGAALGSGGPLYAPDRLVVWARAHAAGRLAAPIGWDAWSVVLLVAVGVPLAVQHARGRRRAPPADTHGSARWGRGDALARDQGLLVGRRGRRLFRVAGEGHVLTVAPTRAGKGVSAVIPNLLDHPGSILVTDPKGENYAVTARWRRARGQAIHAFDPFALADGDATYNPLDLLDAESADAVDDARLLADMLVLPEAGEARAGEQAFWNEEARGVLTGLLLHVAASAPPELRTLAHVRTLLTLPPAGFADLLAAMQASPAAGGLVARAAARILQKAEKERSGVLSTAHSHTHFLDSPRMARVLARSTLDFAALKRDGASVYLILPPDRLDAYARWLRLMIACALLALARTRGQPPARVLFLLDEFAHLGRMHPVQRDIGLAGGFGVRFWLVIQDLAQLRSAYGATWPTFLANVEVLQAFGINDWETAEYLSKMTGDATVPVESEQTSHGVSRGRQGHHQRGAARTRTATGRRLLLPDEVRRLPRDTALLFVRGDAPLLVDRLHYRRDREFVGRADPNPLYAPVAAGGG